MGQYEAKLDQRWLRLPGALFKQFFPIMLKKPQIKLTCSLNPMNDRDFSVMFTIKTEIICSSLKADI